MLSREQLKTFLLEELADLESQTGVGIPTMDETPLFGSGAALDSIGLVMLITGFEARLNDALSQPVIIASEKAMSMSRSPFRTIGTLLDFASEQILSAGN